jgi:DNA-binding XRE family transcriptional regulator
MIKQLRDGSGFALTSFQPSDSRLRCAEIRSHVALRPAAGKAKAKSARHVSNDTNYIVTVNTFCIAQIAMAAGMTTGAHPAGDRLRQAREEAGYKTAAEAAEALGLNVVTYRAHENHNGYWSQLDRYTRFFRVSADWLVTGRHPKRHKSAEIDIVGHVGAGAVVYGIDGDRSTSRIDSIAGIDPSMVIALKIKGTSQWPRYIEGEMVLVEREARGLKEATGRYAVAICEDGRHLLKLIRAQPNGLVTLESHNAPPEINIRVFSFHLVRGTITK